MQKQLLTIFTLCAFTFITTKNDAQNFSAGGGHSVFLCADGHVMNCGANVKGQLCVPGGGADGGAHPVPMVISGLTGVIAVSAGQNYSLFLKSDGTVWGSGDNNYSQLGVGTFADFYTHPVQITSLSNIVAIEAGWNHSLFLKNDGTVWACGRNTFGQYGDGTTSVNYYPSQVHGPNDVGFLTGIVDIAAGEEHSVFLKNDGTVWCSGKSGVGLFGMSYPYGEAHTPVRVDSLTDIIQVAAGLGSSLFLKNDGTVWGCGGNYGGFTNPGLSMSSLLSGIVAVSTGDRYSVFLKNDGTVWGTGYNNGSGQLGNGATTSATTPVMVAGLTDVVAIDAGTNGDHSLFLKSDGTVWACGNNTFGQIADGTSGTLRYNAVQSTGLCSITSMAENDLETIVSLYPNPAITQISLQLNTFLLKPSLTLRNCVGQTVRQINCLPGNNFTFYRDELLEGLYFITINEAGKTVATRKLLIADH